MTNTPGQLLVLKCKVCGKLYIPPKYMCPACESSEFTEVKLSGKGKIITYTTIRVPPLGFEDQAPYNIVIIRLDEGINVTARITDGGRAPNIGDKVAFIKKEKGAHWFKFSN